MLLGFSSLAYLCLRKYGRQILGECGGAAADALAALTLDAALQWPLHLGVGPDSTRFGLELL